MGQSVGKFILASIVAVGFVSCDSDAGLSDSFETFISPDNPFIIQNDTQIGTGDDSFTVTAPWFATSITLVNEHPTYTLIIPSVKIEVTGFNNGVEVNSDPITLDVSNACIGLDDPDRLVFATVQPGDVWYGDLNCDITNDGVADAELWYVGGLPESDTTAYTATVTVEGFFEDASDGADRIKGRARKIRVLTTQ